MSAMPSLLDLLRVVQDPSTWNAVTHVQGGSFHFSYLTNPSQTWPWTCLLDDSRSYGIGINVYHHTNSRKLNLVVKIPLEPAYPELFFFFYQCYF